MDDTLEKRERYKDILDKEGNKLGIEKKYKLVPEPMSLVKAIPSQM